MKKLIIITCLIASQTAGAFGTDDIIQNSLQNPYATGFNNAQATMRAIQQQQMYQQQREYQQQMLDIERQRNRLLQQQQYQTQQQPGQIYQPNGQYINGGRW